MRAGLIDADLGGGVFKKRVAVPGSGKRGSARVLVATQFADRWFFMFGFMKSQRANINRTELKTLRSWAEELLSLDDPAVDAACRAGELYEIDHQPTTSH